MPGSSTTPGRPGTRAHAPVRIAFHLRNSVGTRDMNLCGAQWLAYVFPYRRFAAALTGDHARLGFGVGRYSVTMSDLHRLLVAGLPAHCERFWTLPAAGIEARWLPPSQCLLGPASTEQRVAVRVAAPTSPGLAQRCQQRLDRGRIDRAAHPQPPAIGKLHLDHAGALRQSRDAVPGSGAIVTALKLAGIAARSQSCRRHPNN